MIYHSQTMRKGSTEGDLCQSPSRRAEEEGEELEAPASVIRSGSVPARP